MAIAYIGLGSNLADPAKQLQAACAALARLAQSKLAAVSHFYRNPPLGPRDQPDYVNAVARLETSLDPLALLDALHVIEAAQGRVRTGPRWGPRTLDLDLLMYDGLTLRHERLQLPHPGIAGRSFVLLPLADVAPADLEIPGAGALATLLAKCSTEALRRLEMGDE